MFLRAKVSSREDVFHIEDAGNLSVGDVVRVTDRFSPSRSETMLVEFVNSDSVLMDRWEAEHWHFPETSTVEVIGDV